MDITSTSQTSADLRPAMARDIGETAPRDPMRLDAASWVAVAAFVVYIGVGLLA